MRSLGGGFQLSADDAAALAAQKRSARRSLVLGLLSVVGGVALLAFLGPRAFLGGQGPIVAGGLIAFGLFKVGTNIGTT